MGVHWCTRRIISDMQSVDEEERTRDGKTEVSDASIHQPAIFSLPYRMLNKRLTSCPSTSAWE